MDFTSHSRSVRAIKYIEQLYQLSLTHSFMTRLGGVIKNSRVFSFFSKLVERDSSAATSLTFKALEYLCDKARKPDCSNRHMKQFYLQVCDRHP